MGETNQTTLHAIGEELSVRTAKPLKAGEGVIDDVTFKTIEVDKVFDAVNSASTVLGQATLYRTLTRPSSSADAVRAKQDALNELDSNSPLRERVEDIVAHAARYEQDFYRLVFGEFVGFLGTPRGKLDTEGYGYEPYRNGTKLMLDLVAGVQGLPAPETPYLKALVDIIGKFESSTAYTLMRGPVYLTERGVKTATEKGKYTPALKFRPTVFKPGLIATVIASLVLLLKFGPVAASGIGAAALPVLMILLFPAAMFYVPMVGSFDRSGFICPLRDRYKASKDVHDTLEALGKIDELLCFRRYAHGFGSATVLPTIVETGRHSIILRKAKNPVLGKGNFEYVSNDINLDGHRLTFVTGPNSGGKTAFCKTIAQIQVLTQIGCYVPAETAEVSVADRIFYQVPEISSLDDQEGRFGTELRRTREIFMAIGPQSLVILDELSEGTTYEEKLETSLNILNGFYRIGNNTVLITHNHELVDRFRKKRIGQYRQVEFAADSPTYRLIDGISRVSHADRVAKKIGFAKEDIERYLTQRGYVG